MPEIMTDVLLSEYETIIAGVGENATDTQIIAALVRDADWTVRGAREVVQLARKYGTSILRNALAVASAMNIEDGTSGL
jgi:spore coat protein CotH